MLVLRILSLPRYKCTSTFGSSAVIRRLLTHPILLIVCFFCSTIAVWAQANQVIIQSPDDSTKKQVIQIQTGDTLSLTKAQGSLNEMVKYTAKDSIEMDAKRKQVHLYGEAKVDYEDLTLRADYIYIDFNTSTVYAFGKKDTAGNYIGNSEFTQGGQNYKVRHMAYNFKTKKGRLSELVTKEGESIIRGNNVYKDENNNSFIKGAQYTTCDAEHPHFYINATKLKIIPEKQVITGPAFLVIEDVPTPGIIPFGFFPITKKQKSGVLIPMYGNSPDRGFFLRGGGYYFAFNDYLHTELRGDIYTMGSWGLYTHTTYKKRYHYNGNLDLKYYYNILNAGDELTKSISKDFWITWTHRADQKASPNSQFSASVNAGTSNALRLNSYTPQTFTQNQLISTISYSTSFGKNRLYNLTSNLSHSQNTSTHVVEMKLPDVYFSVNRLTPFQNSTLQQGFFSSMVKNLGLQYSASFSNHIRTVDSLLFDRKTLDTMNYGMVHSLPINTSTKIFKYFSLSPAITITDYMYLKTVNKVWDSISKKEVTLPVNGFRSAYTYSASVSLTTRLFSMLQFKKGKIRAVRHVLTPTVQWYYQPDFSQSRFGNYKTVQTGENGQTRKYSVFEQGLLGGPGQGKQGSINYSLMNNIEMKVMKGKDTARHENKVKIIESLTISGNYNFLADSLKFSQIGLSTFTTLFRFFQLQFNAAFDPYVYGKVTTSTGSSYTQRFNSFEWKTNGRWARLISYRIPFTATLNPDMFKKNKKGEAKRDRMKELGMNPNDYIDFDMPWNLSFSFTYDYSRPYNVSTYTQTLNFSGDVSLTKNWKVAFTSGYDFRNKGISVTSFDIHRNLHCWDFSLQWIPFGYRTSYFFTIKVRSSALQELKLTRRRDWFDQGAGL